MMTKALTNLAYTLFACLLVKYGIGIYMVMGG